MNFHRSIIRQGLRRGFTWVAFTAITGLLAAGCDSSNGGSTADDSLTGTVANTAGIPLVGAIVYLVPASAVSTEEITGAGVLAGTTEGFDEPLEDAVAASGTTFTQGVTDTAGAYEISDVPTGMYFVYVAPAAGDTEHFPGGSLCRVAVSDAALRGTARDITMSSSPPASARYMGMTVCLVCHTSYTDEKAVAHRLGFRRTGRTTSLQDTSEHPEIDDGLAYFLEGNSYDDGTPVYHYDRDATRGFDDFKTSLTDPSDDGGVVWAILWLWKDERTGEYKITIENVGNPDDPNNFSEHVAQLTYGGAVQKQRYMIDWPGREGLYPILQFQTHGDDARYDRTRKVFRDYHLDFYWSDGGTVGDPSDDLITAPDITRNISRNCLGCHATNYTQYVASTGEVLCDTVEDNTGGDYDIDGDGKLNDLNTGCESCHGPGSNHVALAGPRYIISPEYLSPNRQVQLCGRCHNRQAGADPIGGDHPLNADSEFPPPGISRSEFLAEYVAADHKGPLASEYWADFSHAKSHHQQTPDFIKSAHYRNDNRLVTCSDCHDVHGGTGYRRVLIADPDAAESPLCTICHGDDTPATGVHTAAMTGQSHGAAVASCASCHMVKTAKTGSGTYGFVLAPPTGDEEDDGTIYMENDITSHVFDVPGKENIGVRGVLPVSAMPIPYTQSCGTCHDPSNLQYE